MRNKTLYKTFLMSVKYQPALVCFLYLLYYIFVLLGFQMEWAEVIGKESLLSLTYFYTASVVFRFCFLHRIFIHFLTFCDITTIYDEHFDDSLSVGFWCALKLIIGVVLFVIYFKYRLNVKRHN